MQTTKVPISSINLNPSNPRVIKDYKFEKLVRSIREFPKMLELRPIVVNEDNVILGGNMRYRACVEAGLEDVYIVQAKDLTEEQQKEFIVKDNVSFGDWDFEVLANEWDIKDLEDWSVALPTLKYEDEEYSTKVESPIYETKLDKPNEEDLYNLNKYNELIKEIEESNLSEKEKTLLRLTATRHIEFSYSKIADYYAHSSKEMQGLMENSALIIIDYKKAIEKGFVKLYDTFEILSSENG